MVDLQGQYLKIKDEIDRAISKVLEHGSFIKGPEVKAFETELADYLGIKEVIACANGTDALQLALMALGLKTGDEVITTPFTFVSTVEVIRLLGLKPVFVDVDRETFNISTDELENAITPRTRAVVPVHLFGQCADMETIMQLAEKHGIHVIEDSAQATGAEYTFSSGKSIRAGACGIVGTTSFFPSKNLGCYGDGGALFTNDEELASRLRSLANHGMGKRYHYEMTGINSRLDSVQAAILRVKLKYLDRYNHARQEVAAFYNNELQYLPAIKTPYHDTRSTHIYHQYTLQVLDESREDLRAWLEKKMIPSMIYYPVPLHLQKAYTDPAYPEGSLPVSEELSKRVLSLPVHTEFEKEQLLYITSTIKEFYKGSYE